MSWKATFPCNRVAAEALGNDHPDLAMIDPAPVLAASEIDEDRDQWQIEAYFEGRPPRSQLRTIGHLLGLKAEHTPKPREVEDADWVTMSQAGLEPVRAGRFCVHTGDTEPDDTPGIVNFKIDAGQAFGTGHHETTAGCLAMLDNLHRRGQRFGNIIDVGTGTGLLAFAAMHLWPRAAAMASDIDPVSINVSVENAAANGVAIGIGGGALMLAAADGTDHPLIIGRAPYDLVIANILAKPLIALAPAIAEIIAPGGTLILAGLLDKQRRDVVSAYRRMGFRLDKTGVALSGRAAQWPALHLTMRERTGHRRPIRARRNGGLPPGDFGTW